MSNVNIPIESHKRLPVLAKYMFTMFVTVCEIITIYVLDWNLRPSLSNTSLNSFACPMRR